MERTADVASADGPRRSRNGGGYAARSTTTTTAQGRAAAADRAVMAGNRRLNQDVRRFRRWLHLTPHAFEGAQLAAAMSAAAGVLALFWAVSEIGAWAWIAAALPVLTQIRQQFRLARRRRSDQRRDLSSPSLSGADLTGAELGGGYLRAKDLTGARLVQANLVGADLTEATLDGARLRKADLSYGSLAAADCTKASFFRAWLVETDLERVDARGASFEEADLRRASFVDANLLGVRFRGADARGANFTGAKLAADALGEAIVDASTVFDTGRAGAAIGAPAIVGWRTGAGLALRRTVSGLARPALLGLAWSVGIGGTVVAADMSGEGLAIELAEATSADRSTPGSGSGTLTRPSTIGGGRGTADPSDIDIDTDRGPGSAGSLPVEGPGSTTGLDDEGVASTREGTAGSVAEGFGVPPLADGDDRSPTGGSSPGLDPAAATGAGLGDADVENGIVPGDAGPSGASLADGDDEQGDGSSTTAGSGSPTTTEPSRAGPDDLVEVVTSTPSGRAASAPLVRLIVASEGGSSTATFVTALGRSDPRTVDGQDRWELNVPSGGVAVEVVPGGPAVATSCAVLVDDVQRSFQAGLPGQTSTCAVDLVAAG